MPTRLLQVPDVPGMEQVEDSVGEDDDLACGPQFLHQDPSLRKCEHRHRDYGSFSARGARDENVTFDDSPVTTEEYPDQDCMRTSKTTQLIMRLRCIMPLFSVFDERGSVLRQVILDVQPREIPPEEIDRILEAQFSRLKSDLTIAVADKMRPAIEGDVTFNTYMLRCSVGGLELTLFADGRAIVKGTADPNKARTLYAKYIGS